MSGGHHSSPLRGNRSTGQAPSHKTTHHMSCFPTSLVKMPSRAGGQVQGNSPHAARRGWHHVSTAPSAALLHGVLAEVPSPVLVSTPGCFFPAHDLPDLLNKPPSSTAFLVGKVVKCSNRCWKRQGGGRTKPHLQELKGRLGFGFFFFSPQVATQKQSPDRDLSCWGQLPAPHPSGQSKPGQTEMKHRRVLQGTHAASAAAMVTLPRSGAQVGGPQPAPAAEGSKAAGARSGRPTSTKNAAVVINNFPASEQNCTPHPFWEASLS